MFILNYLPYLTGLNNPPIGNTVWRRNIKLNYIKLTSNRVQYIFLNNFIYKKLKKNSSTDSFHGQRTIKNKSFKNIWCYWEAFHLA